MNATIFSNTDVTFATGDEVIFHEEVKGEVQGSPFEASCSTFVGVQF